VETELRHALTTAEASPPAAMTADEYAGPVSESVLHTVRAQTVGVHGVNLIFAATASMERGLENFSLLSVARLERKPAWLSLNPLMSIVLRTLRPDSYRSLRASG
jgi:hypothetical protein